MRRSIAVVALALGLGGCGPAGPPTLDASSDAAYAASTERMCAGMTRDQQFELGRSVGILTYTPEPTAAEFAAGKRSLGEAEGAKALHGLTAAQINDRAAAKLRADAAAGGP